MKLNLNGYTIWIGFTRIKKCMQKLAYFEIIFFYNFQQYQELSQCGITERVATFLFKVHDIRVFAYCFAWIVVFLAHIYVFIIFFAFIQDLYFYLTMFVHVYLAFIYFYCKVNLFNITLILLGIIWNSYVLSLLNSMIILYVFAATFCAFPKMKSKTLVCVVLCQLVVLTWLTPAQGKGLLSNLMKQAETLSHGLDLASKVGDIG